MRWGLAALAAYWLVSTTGCPGKVIHNLTEAGGPDGGTPSDAGTVDGGVLVIVTTSLPAGVTGAAYSSTLAATGGTPPYGWAISAGQLPSGLSLAPSGGISGQSGSSGAASFTVRATDSASPAQSATAQLSINTFSTSATTWYVRPGGGTSTQCLGTTDADYSGSGAGQPCAFQNPMYLWDTGSWRIAGGDTVIVRGSSTYRIGALSNDVSNTGWSYCSGNPYGCTSPPVPSGTAARHTQILGENYQTCLSDSAKAHTFGGNGAYSVWDVSGASYVDLGCLDISDYSSCGRAAQTNTCNTGTPLSDYANFGVLATNTTSQVTLTDVAIHGIAIDGWHGATGPNTVLTRVRLSGNASSGMELDDGTVGVGDLYLNGVTIEWSGCTEEYPMVDAVPYGDCTDQTAGGYGDGLGTGTYQSTQKWVIHVNHSTARYNTQDGFDLVHLRGAGSHVEFYGSTAYGNMGSGFKVGAGGSVFRNNVLVGNCMRMSEPFTGAPAGYNSRLTLFCRANDMVAGPSLDNGTVTLIQNNTFVGENPVSFDIECDSDFGNTCDSSTVQLVFQNNLFVGFSAFQQGGVATGELPGIYIGPNLNTGIDLFANPGSAFDHNLWFHQKQACPDTHESAAQCGDALLAAESNIDSIDAHLGSASPARGTGVNLSDAGVAVDFSGSSRPSTGPFDIGAYQYGSP